MNRRALRLWGILLLACGLIAGIAVVFPLYSPHDDNPSIPWGGLSCGDLIQVRNYPAHPNLDNNPAPWAGVNDSGPAVTDSKYRDGCLGNASIAESVALGAVGVAVILLITSPFVLLRRRSDPGD